MECIVIKSVIPLFQFAYYLELNIMHDSMINEALIVKIPNCNEDEMYSYI
jgi:hypothetical protein